MHKDLSASLSDRLKKYVDHVSLESHPSANGVFGKKKDNDDEKESSGVADV